MESSAVRSGASQRTSNYHQEDTQEYHETADDSLPSRLGKHQKSRAKHHHFRNSIERHRGATVRRKMVSTIYDLNDADDYPSAENPAFSSY
jgi:hypothetical protein